MGLKPFASFGTRFCVYHDGENNLPSPRKGPGESGELAGSGGPTPSSSELLDGLLPRVKLLLLLRLA